MTVRYDYLLQRPHINIFYFVMQLLHYICFKTNILNEKYLPSNILPEGFYPKAIVIPSNGRPFVLFDVKPNTQSIRYRLGLIILGSLIYILHLSLLKSIQFLSTIRSGYWGVTSAYSNLYWVKIVLNIHQIVIEVHLAYFNTHGRLTWILTLIIQYFMNAQYFLLNGIFTEKAMLRMYPN